MKYTYEYEYRNKLGRLCHVKTGQMFEDYNSCDRALCDAMSDAVDRGYTDVQGDIIEIEEEGDY